MLKHPKHLTHQSTMVITLLVLQILVAHSEETVPFCDSLIKPGVSKYIIRMVLFRDLTSKNIKPKREESFRIIKRKGNEELTKNLQECEGISGLPRFHRCEYDSKYLKISEEKFYMNADEYDVYRNLQKKLLPDKLGLYKGLAETLYEIHSKGLYHLNIKPKNIWADSKEISKLFLSGIEFGKEIKGPGKSVSWHFDTPLFYSLQSWTSKKQTQDVGIPDEVRALILSILLIETDFLEMFLGGYKNCLKNYILSRCFEAITNEIAKYFLKNQEAWIKQCGEKAVASYKEAFDKGLSLGKVHRVNSEEKTDLVENSLDSKELFDILEKAESECISFNKKDTESSKQSETNPVDSDLKRLSDTTTASDESDDIEGKSSFKSLNGSVEDITQILV
jgi:hypothetical protein